MTTIQIVSSEVELPEPGNTSAVYEELFQNLDDEGVCAAGSSQEFTSGAVSEEGDEAVEGEGPRSIRIPYICAQAADNDDFPRPARPRILEVPNITHPKRKGEWAESFFECCALALDFNILRTAGDSAPFDRGTEYEGTVYRVQVKSAWESCVHGYRFSTSRADKSVTYTQKHIDFIAGLVVPEDLWYIIPVETIPQNAKEIKVWPVERPELRDKLGRRVGWSNPRNLEFEQFREAWDLLK